MDTDIKKFLAKTIRESIKEEVAQAITVTVLPIFVKMLQDSEQRVEGMKGIVHKLSDTCSANTKLYEKHLSELQKTKNSSLDNMTKLIDANKELTKQLEHQITQINILSNDFKDKIKYQEVQMKELTDRYTRLAEMSLSGKRSSDGRSSSKSDVKVDIKH